MSILIKLIFTLIQLQQRESQIDWNRYFEEKKKAKQFIVVCEEFLLLIPVTFSSHNGASNFRCNWYR